MTDRIGQILLLSHTAATFYMLGVIWFVQLVHYPLFAAVGKDFFTEYEKRHQSWTTYVVAPGMLVEGLTGFCRCIIRLIAS